MSAGGFAAAGVVNQHTRLIEERGKADSHVVIVDMPTIFLQGDDDEVGEEESGAAGDLMPK